jgi:TOD1/MUCI70, glycosyltransferase-like domain
MRCVLYACTDLAYDQIFSPVTRTPGVDFVLYADRRPRLVRGWQWRPLPPSAQGLSPALANRYCKFFPHEILPEAELSIYVDANTLILADLRPLIAEFLASDADIGLFPHMERMNIAEELAFGRAVGRIPPEDAARGEAQLRFYRDEGLPPDHVLTENAVLFRRHDRPALAPAMQLWWEQLERFTKRDQLSLPYVLHTSDLRTFLWDWNYKKDNPYFMRYPHRKTFQKNVRTYLNNRTYYGPANRLVFGALLGASYAVLGRSAAASET